MTGQEGLRLAAGRPEKRSGRTEKAVRRHSLESIVPEGVEAHVDHFVGLDDPDSS
jgi:hypothetical protein